MNDAEQVAFTEKQSARYLAVSEATLRLWRSLDKAPRYYRAGKLVRYRKSDLDAWVEARMSAPAGVR